MKLNFLKTAPLNVVKITLLNEEEIAEKKLTIPFDIGYIETEFGIFVRTEKLNFVYDYMKGRYILENVIENIIKHFVISNTDTQFMFTQSYNSEEDLYNSFVILQAYKKSTLFKINDLDNETFENLFFNKTIKKGLEKIENIINIDHNLGSTYNKTRLIIDSILHNDKQFYEIIQNNKDFGQSTYFINLYNSLQDKKEEDFNYNLLDPKLNDFHDIPNELLSHTTESLKKFYFSKPDTIEYIRDIFTKANNEDCVVTKKSSNDPYFNYLITTTTGREINVASSFSEISIKDTKCYDYLINKCLTELPVNN